MLIDWFTIGAQALNFLVLVWLMKRFLYGPILGAIAAREKGVETELANANDKATQAQKLGDEFKKKNDELKQKAADLMKQATVAAQTENERLLKVAATAAESLKLAQAKTFQTETQNLFQSLRDRTHSEVLAMARKVIGDLSGVSLEDRMIDVFIQRLQALSAEKIQLLSAKLGTSEQPALVRTAAPLSSAQRSTLEDALKRKFGVDVRFQFETSPALISGIELSANGQSLSWSVSDYLQSLQTSMHELLSTKDASV